MLLAEKLRQEKILTESMLKEIVTELAPVNINKTTAEPPVTKITSLTDGLQTSHYMLKDLLGDTYSTETEALPEDTYVPVGPTYKITYVSEKGTAPNAKAVKSMANKEYTLVAGDVTSLTAEGYTFKGWYIGTTLVEAGYVINGDVTLTAQWEEA